MSSINKIGIIAGHVIAALLPTVARSVRRWLFHLGGLGLIPLGLLDSSPIPIPGAMDVAMIVLSARQEQLWLYYALMATAGSVIGGFVTYRLARKGGKRSARTQVLAPESGQSLQDLRAMGVRRYCHPCFAAASYAHGSISVCGGRYAISGKKIPGRAHAQPNLQIHGPGLLGRTLWTANNRVHLGTRTPCRSGSHRVLIAIAAVIFYFWRGSKSKKRAWKRHDRPRLRSPVIFMTAHGTDEEARARALAAGAVAYLIKPFDQDELWMRSTGP